MGEVSDISKILLICVALCGYWWVIACILVHQWTEGIEVRISRSEGSESAA